MAGRGVSFVAALTSAGLTLTIVASAQERSAPPGAVVVRPVQVREVRVNPPVAQRHEDQRQHAGPERPIDPGFLSRPVLQQPQPQSRVTRSPRSVHSGHARNRFYTFTPRFNMGYGVVVGYPIIYPYAYPYDPFSPSVPVGGYSYAAPPPSPNTYSNVDSLYTNRNVTAASPRPAAIACQGSAPCGGLSFDIAPGNAQVWVDGVFSGLADDFDATSTPLLLAPGDHYVEIRVTGYRSAAFDVTIAASEVTPYQGTLEQLRLRTP